MAAYQEVDDRGQVVAFVDEKGVEFDVPPGCESHVVEDDAKPPFSDVVRLYREPDPIPTIRTDKDTLTRELTEKLVAANVPQNFIDQIVGDLLAAL